MSGRILKKEMHRQVWANVVGGFIVIAVLLWLHKHGKLLDASG